MARNIWIGVVVVVVLAAGGWWYLNQSSTMQTTGYSTLQETNNGTQQPTTYIPPAKTSQQQQLSSSNQITGWKTYKSDKYGFEFQYPQSMDFRIEERGIVVNNAPAVGFSVTDANGKIKFSVLVSPTALSPEAVIKQIQDAQDKEEGVPSASLVVTGTRTVSGEHAVIERAGIYVVHNGYLYILAQENVDNPTLGTAPPSEEFLATFKFTL